MLGRGSRLRPVLGVDADVVGDRKRFPYDTTTGRISMARKEIVICIFSNISVVCFLSLRPVRNFPFSASTFQSIESRDQSNL